MSFPSAVITLAPSHPSSRSVEYLIFYLIYSFPPRPLAFPILSEEQSMLSNKIGSVIF